MDNGYSDTAVQNTYRTVLLCFRNPSSDKGMNDFTERSLAQFHAELARRGLPRDPGDDTKPDLLAGYRTVQVRGKSVGDVLSEPALVAALEWAYCGRSGKLRTTFAVALEAYAEDFEKAGVGDIDAFGAEFETALNTYFGK